MKKFLIILTIFVLMGGNAIAESLTKQQLDDVDVNVKCQVSIVEGNLAQIKFKDLPKDVANKITFRYMRMANR